MDMKAKKVVQKRIKFERLMQTKFDKKILPIILINLRIPCANLLNEQMN